MKYFLDNDISPRFALMLRALSVDIVALRDIYAQDTKDPEFLGDLKKLHGVDVFISKDTAQRANAVEAALLKQSGVTSLHFNPFFGKLQFWAQAKWLVTHWDKIDGFARGSAMGTFADIQQNGRSRIYHL